MLLMIFWVLAFWLTHMPMTDTSMVKGFLDFLPSPDKWVHAGLYFVLSALLANCLGRWIHSNGWMILLTLGITGCYAAADEYLQKFIPSRTCDFYDFLADMAGANIGLVTFLIWRTVRRRKRSFLNSQTIGKTSSSLAS